MDEAIKDRIGVRGIAYDFVPALHEDAESGAPGGSGFRPARLATRAASFRYGGRHHPGIPGGIIPLYPGGFVGIRSQASRLLRRGRTASQAADVPIRIPTAHVPQCRLAGSYGVERVEAAAERAIEIGARTYGSVKSILDNKLDRRPAQKRATDGTPILHANIRGPRYYN